MKPKITKYLFITTVTLMLVLFLGSCEMSTNTEEIDLLSESSKLYVRSSRIWTDSQIPVCWTNDGFENEKKWVRNEITNTWQSVAGVTFTGWGLCTSDVNSGIVITPGTANVVSDGLGETGDGTSPMELDFSASPETRWTRCINNSLSREECIRATSIHEFGHSLAFAHEHLRADETGCTADDRGTYGDTTLTPYDEISIMNYCGDATGLSEFDILGAQICYPEGVEVSSKCHDGCFFAENQLIIRDNGSVQDEWKSKGAYDWWDTNLHWRNSNSLIYTGSILPASALQAGSNSIHYTAIIDIQGASLKSETTKILVDNSKWTAIAMASL